jgi:hypothetical protein
VSVKKMPELAELLDNEEEFDELCRLPAEKILLRWFNFHLKRSGYKKEVTNFGTDIKVVLMPWFVCGVVCSGFQHRWREQEAGGLTREIARAFEDP